MNEVKKTIEMSEPYPGYPSSRYVVDADTVDMQTVPDGPWNAKNIDLPTVDQAKSFLDAGYTIDSLGRPLHPDYIEMVTNPDVGVVAGKGFYRHWGPNFTADPIVITKTAQPRVLLIKRGDTNAWALPGGFVDPTDTDTLAAARREAKEEAGIDIDAEAVEIYRGVVGDRRTTAHAWAETGAYLMQPDRQSIVEAADDAKDARWVRLDQLSGHLFGSHNFLINEALSKIEFSKKTPIADILSLPKESLDVEIIDAGHMAYDHYFISNTDSCLFVKEHDASRFTDAFREAHSRQYLRKEYAVYEHVAERGFSDVPDRVELVEDHLLAMDALREDEGWRWRAPRDDAIQLHQYVQDVLHSFDQLQRVRIPDQPDYHDVINPTHETFWAEGWDDITDETEQPLLERINGLSAYWTDKQRENVAQLVSELPRLRVYASHMDRQPELFMAHNDARQSNIAWNPDEGARIVDWSWADPAPKNADSTMFIIDLAKSGYDITPYLKYVNKDQVVLLIGMWLAHSRWNTRDGSLTVRRQQLASAVAAHQLLGKL